MSNKRTSERIETLTALKRAKFNSFLQEIKDGQKQFKQKLEEFQERLAAIEDFLSEEGDDSQGGSQDSSESDGTEREGYRDYGCGASDNDRGSGIIE